MSHKKKDKDQDEVGKFSNLRIPLPESGGWKLAFLASLAVASVFPEVVDVVPNAMVRLEILPAT